MPAAAVIPAPEAYIEIVAVKKLVVEVQGELPAPLRETGVVLCGAPSYEASKDGVGHRRLDWPRAGPHIGFGHYTSNK